MNLISERMKWKHDAAAVNKLADGMIEMIVDAGGDTPVIMSVDMVLRPYLQWLQSAQRLEVDPEKARSSVVMLISAMIMEISSRMGIKEEGNSLPKAQWIKEFITDIVGELNEDMHQLHGPPPAGPTH